MNDQLWQAIRYILVGIGTFLAGQGMFPLESVGPFADAILAVVGGLMLLGGMAWGFYVKWGTKAVPAKAAARADVPTVSAATGQVEK